MVKTARACLSRVLPRIAGDNMDVAWRRHNVTSAAPRGIVNSSNSGSRIPPYVLKINDAKSRSTSSKTVAQANQATPLPTAPHCPPLYLPVSCAGVDSPGAVGSGGSVAKGKKPGIASKYVHLDAPRNIDKNAGGTLSSRKMRIAQ